MSLIDYNLSGTTCVLRLNAPPVNAITFALLDELREALRRVNGDPQVHGIVITGTPHHFSAGADVNLFREITCAEDAVRTSRVFQEAFQEIEDSDKPVSAAVASKVMGSALELAMACHFRVCAKDTRFSMPEVNLGINPGAGGTQRLPRLIGAGPALQMLLTGATTGADEALAAGLVDAICEEGEMVDSAVVFQGPSQPPPRTSERTDKVRDPEVNDAAFARAEEMMAKVRPGIIAPSRIADAVKTGLTESFQEGIRKEQQAFAACMDTLPTQNKIYLFFATRDTANAPSLAGAEPVAITKAGVVGMGSMGTGIAHALILAGVPVVALDQSKEIVEKGLSRIRNSIEKRVAQQRCSREKAEEMLGLVRTSTNWQDLSDVGLVIEAVFEDVPAKRTVIEAIEEACSADVIIASNTSTISLDLLAEGMRRPERLVGIHFFNPAHRLPLVEVIHRNATPPGITATAMRFVKSIRKTPVLVSNREGFIVNRMFVPYLKEAFWLLEDGATPRDIERAIVEFGFPMGPFVLIDMAGLDILAMVDAVMCRVFPRHGSLSPIALRLVDAGHLGQKSGCGVYRYEKGDRRPHDSDVTGQIVRRVREDKGIVARDVSEEEITERLVLRMVNEAFYIMEEGIAQHQSDLDAATVLGMAFPDFRGGVLKYAHDLGLDTVRARIEDLAGRFGERFAPCELLCNMKGNG